MAEGMLKDRVALITGAAEGIGEGTARLFAEHGAHVYVLDVNAEGAEAVAASIRAGGGSAFPMAADVRKMESIRKAVEAAMARFGRVEILINNAGIYPRRDFLEMTEQDWDAMQEVNLKGVFLCTRAVMPHMVERRWGKVVNISSVTFFKGLARLTHYVASKGGVIGFTRSLAREMGPHNVHVNCITPGAIQVPNEMRMATAEEIEGVIAQQSLQRRLKPLDVARVALFLSCELSDGMTGQTVNVDGGVIMH